MVYDLPSTVTAVPISNISSAPAETRAAWVRRPSTMETGTHRPTPALTHTVANDSAAASSRRWPVTVSSRRIRRSGSESGRFAPTRRTRPAAISTDETVDFGPSEITSFSVTVRVGSARNGWIRRHSRQRAVPWRVPPGPGSDPPSSRSTRCGVVRPQTSQ